MNIQQLSNETGIGVDALRIWERRYGFPAPERDTRGFRIYSAEQVEELRLVKTLLDHGRRPGKIFALSAAERRDLVAQLVTSDSTSDQGLRKLVEEGSPSRISAELTARRNELGLEAFVVDVALPLLQLLDHGWTMGRINVAREHLVSDRLEELLKRELSAEEDNGERPQVLFLTLSGERHKLGLLLAATLFKQAGVAPLWLNEELPLSEIPALADELQVAGVALSFSSHYSPRQAREDLGLLRRSLSPRIRLIAGGQSVHQLPSLKDLIISTDLQQIPQLVKRHFLHPLKG